MKTVTAAVVLATACLPPAIAGYIDESGQNPMGMSKVKASLVTNTVATPAQSESQPAAMTKAPERVWVLEAGRPIHLQLEEWAKEANWDFKWHPEKGWLVPARKEFTGTFDRAIEEVIEGLYSQGKPVRLVIWEGNNFAEVINVDAR